MTKFTRTTATAILLGALLTTTGCATILGGGSSQPVSIKSTPASARFVVRSSSGIEMAAGQTPETITLPRKNEYQLEFTAPGYQTQKIALTKGTNGWIWGNLFIGWIVGFAVDFATGSAYKLQPALIDISMIEVRADNGAMAPATRVVVRDNRGKTIREITMPLVPLEADVVK